MAVERIIREIVPPERREYFLTGCAVRFRGFGCEVGGDLDRFLTPQFSRAPADACKIRLRLERVSRSYG